jgi:Transposase and inactivated derivatives
VQVASLVRSTLGLKHHRVGAVTRENGRIVVELEAIERRCLPCSACGGFDRVRDRRPQRRWRHLPVWEIPVELRYRPARVACSHCGRPKVEAIPWAMGKSSLSRPLIVELATWSRQLPWDAVAELFGVSWWTVVSAVQYAVGYGLARRDLSDLRILGIDELSRRRGHIYHTNVYDIGRQPRRLIWSGEGREKKTLERFFDEIGPEQARRIEAVCCDMWANYVEVIRQRAPQATLVFDKFHIVRHLLNAVNDVRKAEAKALRKTEPGLLTGTRYIWLKNPKNLTDRQRLRLAELEKRHGLKVLRAYQLKELLRTKLWRYESKPWAKKYLGRWFWWATHSRIEPLRQFAWMLRRHEEGILAYFDFPIDNGAVEAMNNNAKVISHRARGFRSEKAFTLAMLHCLGDLALPPGLDRPS